MALLTINYLGQVARALGRLNGHPWNAILMLIGIHGKDIHLMSFSQTMGSILNQFKVGDWSAVRTRGQRMDVLHFEMVVRQIGER